MDDLKARLTDTLSRRGPDCSGELTIEMKTTMQMGDVDHHLQYSQQLWLYGSVLHIQGDVVAQQPYRDRLGNALLWNGEVFGGLTDSDSSRCCSDTVLVSDRLCEMSARLAEEKGDAAASTTIICERINACLVEVLSAIEGPYSFIFFHAATGSLHFGRDPFGRRSLLLLTRRRMKMTACREEHPSYSLQINDHADDDCSSSQVEPYPLSEGETLDAVDVDDILCIASCSVCTTMDEGSNSASGGNSSSSIRCVWLEVGVRGVYCWIPSPSPVLRRDRETCQLMPRLLQLSPWPADRLTLMRCNHCFSTGLSPHPPYVDIEVSAAAAAAEVFLERLTESIRKRVHSIMHRGAGGGGGGGGGSHASSSAAVGGIVETSCADDPSPLPCNSSSPVGVLFSGGIDSVLLAALLHRVLSSYEDEKLSSRELLPGWAIDLINVTFDKPRPLIGDQSSLGGGTVSPDRVASVAALSELQVLLTIAKMIMYTLDDRNNSTLLHACMNYYLYYYFYYYFYTVSDICLSCGRNSTCSRRGSGVWCMWMSTRKSACCTRRM